MTDSADVLGVVAKAEMRTGAGDWAEAATLWGQVTAANPVNGDYWARLAEARFAAKEYAAAREAYEKVLELGVRAVYRQQCRDDLPELLPGEVAYRIACCQAALGYRDEAIDALAAALDRGFRDLGRAQDEEYWKPWHDDQRLRDLLGIVEVEGLSRDEGWRTDLRLLARELKRRAYAPFALIAEEEFDRTVARLDHDIPGLTDAQILVGMMKLVRHLDDGHAGVRPPADSVELSRLLPLDLFLFSEGLYVIAVGPGLGHLLGAKVEKIGRHTVDEAITALDPIIVRDNQQQVTLMVPVFLQYTAFLRGLGIIDDLAKATLTFRTADGTIREVTLDAEPGERQWDRYPPGWTALADTGLADQYGTS